MLYVKGANLKAVNFKGVNLENAVFLKGDLENLLLEEEQIKGINSGRLKGYIDF